jgi:hypothetical protein
MKPNPAKVKVVQEWPCPKDSLEVRRGMPSSTPVSGGMGAVLAYPQPLACLVCVGPLYLPHVAPCAALRMVYVQVFEVHRVEPDAERRDAISVGLALTYMSACTAYIHVRTLGYTALPLLTGRR